MENEFNDIEESFGKSIKRMFSNIKEVLKEHILNQEADHLIEANSSVEALISLQTDLEEVKSIFEGFHESTSKLLVLESNKENVPPACSGKQVTVMAEGENNINSRSIMTSLSSQMSNHTGNTNFKAKQIFPGLKSS